MKVALSLTGTDGATRNLEAELPGWNFDAVKRASQKRWNERLGGSTSAAARTSSRSSSTPTSSTCCAGAASPPTPTASYLDDTWNIGASHPARSPRRPQFAMYHYDALWLTQWNVNSVLGLAYPEVYSSFVRRSCRCTRTAGCCHAVRRRARTRW